MSVSGLATGNLRVQIVLLKINTFTTNRQGHCLGSVGGGIPLAPEVVLKMLVWLSTKLDIQLCLSLKEIVLISVALCYR